MTEAQGRFAGRGLVSLKEVLRTPADKYGKRLRLILSAIDRLHEIPSTDPINVKIGRGRDILGGYLKHLGTGEPLEIEVSRRENDRMELTFAHEIGHFLEGAVIPGSPFGVRNWVDDEVTRDWRSAVRTTDSFQKLRTIAETGQVTTSGPVGTISNRAVAPEHVSYLMRDQELWARSYAQYVAVRCQHSTMLEQIRPRCFPLSPCPIRWIHDEFGPVAGAIHILFDRLGWLR